MRSSLTSRLAVGGTCISAYALAMECAALGLDAGRCAEDIRRGSAVAAEGDEDVSAG